MPSPIESIRSSATLLALVSLYILSITVMSSFTNKAKLTITSTSFSNNGMIPVKYSCEGEEVSPPLNISDIPHDAQSLAVIIHDPDAPLKGGFTHWVVWNLDVKRDISENFKNGEQGMNSSKQYGYMGMCPPSGTHHYHFIVYALDARLNIDKNTDKTGLEKAMQGHILAQGELIGLYKKTKP